MIKISHISDQKCHLGEGPLWDWNTEVLWWVDSLGPTLYRFDYHTKETRCWNLPGNTIGSLAVRKNGGLILAMDKGFYCFDPNTGKTTSIVEPVTDQSDVRFNDGKVDPFGNFIAGMMNIDHFGEKNCSLFRLSPELKVTKILDGFRCFNGPCFSPGDEKIYLTGRNDGEIEKLAYDPHKQLTKGKTHITDCNPDGATVDKEGFIWSAQWTDECVIRISPDGQIDYRISIPKQIVSSVMFGGPDLDLIYVTTVGGMVGNDMPTAQLAGATLVIEGTGFSGRPEFVFKG